jgi:riboflavin synthase alpha subunit
MEMIHGLHKDTLLEINEVIAPISNIKVGDIVNIEFDIIGKYVAKWMNKG